MSHTPGPWIFDTDDATETYIGAIKSPDSLVAMVFRHHNRLQIINTDRSNGDLLAAAPAMYNMLLACFDQLTDNDQIGQGSYPLAKRVEQALALAEGSHRSPLS